MSKGRNIEDKTKEVRTIPEMIDPFKDREKVKDEIKCALGGEIFEIASLVFAALGVISEGFNIALWLEPMSWLLLAIVAGVLCLPSYKLVLGICTA